MVRALAAYLHDRDFPALGLNRLLQVPAARINLLPKPLRQAAYVASGWLEAFSPRRIDRFDSEEIGRWVTGRYPRRHYPAIAVGSANGAAVHLYAALGIPWLPQTFLLPLRQPVDPQDPRAALRIGVEPGRVLLERNPDLHLHHMHDPNQDRLMVRTMTYFRVKWRRLGLAYEEWIEQMLPPGGTLLVAECEKYWGVTRVGERHVFQHGAVGGAREDEFHLGSERVVAHLDEIGSERETWSGPPPEEQAPEAEWGFEPALLDDVYRIAAERRYRVLRMRFPEPEALTPLVADFHRWWYRRRGLPANRLLGESFIVLDPYWTVRTGSVPYWMEFNMDPSLKRLHAYLDRREPFNHIHLMLFNHGVDSVGLPTADEWAAVFDHALLSGEWAGSDPSAFPADFAQFARYNKALRRIPSRHPLPEPVTLQHIRDFLQGREHEYEVVFEEEEPPDP